MTLNNKNSRIVYSTRPDFSYEEEEPEEMITPPPSQQLLYVSLDKKQRKGKKVTLVSGFAGTENDRKALGKKLKTICGTGGSVKNEIILVQGDFVGKIKNFLEKEGYKVKQKGG